MVQKELMQAVQELIGAKTPEEIMEVLQHRPELLNKENIEQIQEIAVMASLSADWQAASTLENIAEMLDGLVQRISEPSKVTNTAHQPVSQTTVHWARLTREYLALMKKQQLEKAIVSAEQAGEKEIASLLRARQENNIQIIEEHAHDMHQKLLSAGRSEEAWTIALLHLDMRASLAEYFIQFPLEQQTQALDIGIQACKQAADIANMLGDHACTALYLGMAGNGCYRGRRLESAESAYQEALALYRKLAKEQPQVYEDNVATMLNNLGNALIELCRLESAEAAIQEALTLHRKLAKDEPQVYESYVAGTLTNLGIVLRNLHRFESAEAAYQEALTIRRKLAKEQPQVYERDVAMTFNNLGIVLRDLRRLESAEAAYQEALTLYRKLAKEQPQVYKCDVAMTLNNLGNVLSDLRRLESAEAAYQEALILYRKLAKEQPQVYERDVAMTLNNLGTMLSDLHRLGNVLRNLRHLESAEAAYQEALTIRRKLAKEQPQVYERDVAMTLSNLGNVLRDLRRLESAEAAYQEALTLYRKLAKDEPQV